jgi:hypothetical protein
MSALGQRRTSRLQFVMSALPLKADIERQSLHVRFGPKADQVRRRKQETIRLPRRRRLATLAAR